MKKLLIVAHAPSSNTELLAQSLLSGATHPDINHVATELKSPFDCDADLVLQHDALVLFTTENFGYMSGALKDFFERIYYPCLEHEKQNQGKPYALVIRAGLDGTGTDIAVHKIIAGLKWREVQPTLLCHGDHKPLFIEQCHELGMTMAAGLENEIF